jgi:hypothetical protein
MRLVALTEPDGMTVLVNADAVIRVRQATRTQFENAGCVLDFGNGIQAVKEDMVMVCRILGGGELRIPNRKSK